MLVVPLLPGSPCEPDKAIRIALGERHAEKCAMRKTLSGGGLDCVTRLVYSVLIINVQMHESVVWGHGVESAGYDASRMRVSSGAGGEETVQVVQGRCRPPARSAPPQA